MHVIININCALICGSTKIIKWQATEQTGQQLLQLLYFEYIMVHSSWLGKKISPDCHIIYNILHHTVGALNITSILLNIYIYMSIITCWDLFYHLVNIHSLQTKEFNSKCKTLVIRDIWNVWYYSYMVFKFILQHKDYTYYVKQVLGSILKR